MALQAETAPFAAHDENMKARAGKDVGMSCGKDTLDSDTKRQAPASDISPPIAKRIPRIER